MVAASPAVWSSRRCVVLVAGAEAEGEEDGCEDGDHGHGQRRGGVAALRLARAAEHVLHLLGLHALRDAAAVLLGLLVEQRAAAHRDVLPRVPVLRVRDEDVELLARHGGLAAAVLGVALAERVHAQRGGRPERVGQQAAGALHLLQVAVQRQGRLVDGVRAARVLVRDARIAAQGFTS